MKNDGTKNRQRMVHSFSIDYNSEIDGIRYHGNFTSKKLSIRDLAALGVRKSQLNGGMYYDEDKPGFGVDSSTDDLNGMMAHLELAIVQAPSWWKLEEITDLNLISKVFSEVSSFETSFLRSKREEVRTQQESVGYSQGNSGSDTQTTNHAGVSGALVEQEVLSALEP